MKLTKNIKNQYNFIKDFIKQNQWRFDCIKDSIENVSLETHVDLLEGCFNDRVDFKTINYIEFVSDGTDDDYPVLTCVGSFEDGRWFYLDHGENLTYQHCIIAIANTREGVLSYLTLDQRAQFEIKDHIPLIAIRSYELPAKYISVRNDFFGVSYTDHSAQAFNEMFLIPALEDKTQRVEVALDGKNCYSSSWLKDVFGNLEQFDKVDLKNRLKIYSFYDESLVKECWKYITDKEQ